MMFVKTHDVEDLTGDMVGSEVVLGGWVEDFRKMGKMSFITLRDVTGISQIIIKGDLTATWGDQPPERHLCQGDGPGNQGA